MNHKLNKYSVCFLLILACAFSSYAQRYTHQAIIKTDQHKGLYKIALNPDYKQYMSPNLHDMRIYDSAKKEVPYVVLSEPLLKSKSDFKEYEIISQKHFNANSTIHLNWHSTYAYTELIIKNASKESISNIAFNINNSDAYKYCAIEGSDDLKQWYSVSEKQELSLAYNDVYTNQYKCIYFPLTNYMYYRLLVEDWHSQPLKINSAGCFKNSVIAGKLNDLLFAKTITEDPKTKTTLIKLSFTNNQQINRIDFKIKEPRLYKRHVVLYAMRTHVIKMKTESYKENLYEFDLSSDKPLFIDVPPILEKELFIEIDNNDNPPLEIESITCKQLASYLICDFKANHTYTLMCGNELLKTPEYDLINFVSQVPQLLPEAAISPMTELKDTTPVELKKEVSFFETKQFLWICLVIGAIAIFLFSRSLLKDMGSDKN
jgi:hypothetical protein